MPCSGSLWWHHEGLVEVTASKTRFTPDEAGKASSELLQSSMASNLFAVRSENNDENTATRCSTVTNVDFAVHK